MNESIESNCLSSCEKTLSSSKTSHTNDKTSTEGDFITTIHHVDLIDPEFSTIQDHIINGILLMPFAGYLYLIGKHLAISNFIGKKRPVFGSFSYHIWDTFCEKDLIIEGEVDLTIKQHSTNHSFVISVNHDLLVRGFAKMLGENDTLPEENDTLPTINEENSNSLSRDDFYRFMKVLGFDYGKDYKLIETVKFDRSEAIVCHSNDFTSLFTSLLQVDFFWNHQKIIKVPQSVSNFYYDGRFLSKKTTEIEDCRKWLVHSSISGHVSTNRIHFYGIEWKDFDQQCPTALKPKLAYSEFVPFYSEFQLTSEYRQKRLEYISECLKLIQCCDDKIATNDLKFQNDDKAILLRVIGSCKNRQDLDKLLLEGKNLPFYDDLAVTLPDNFFDSILDVLGENLTKEHVNIAVVGEICQNLSDVIKKRLFMWRKLCKFTKLDLLCINKHEINFNLVIIVENTMKCFPNSQTDIDNLINFLKLTPSDCFILHLGRSNLNEIENYVVKTSSKCNSIIFLDSDLETIFEDKLKLCKIADTKNLELNVHISLLRWPLNENQIENFEVVFIEDQTKFGWFSDLREAIREAKSDRIWLISTDTSPNGIIGLFKTLRQEPNGHRIRCMYDYRGENQVKIDKKALKTCKNFVNLQNLDRALSVFKNGSFGHFVLTDFDSIDQIQRQVHFDENKVYIIIGGFGGIGLELIDWMASRGARKFLISSLSVPKSQYQQFCLANVRQQYPTVQILMTRVDLTTPKGCQLCIKKGLSLGDIAGIFNLAAVLLDGNFLDQSINQFESVCRVKVQITMNMDEITRKKCPNLDLFVCFSSVSSNGNPSQSNYAFGNSFMERLCEKRKLDGLPALAVQWGPIGDAGITSRKFGHNEIVGGYFCQRLRSCLETLDLFLNSSHPVCFSAILADRKAVKTSDIMRRVGRILGLKDIKSIDENTPLRELGLDSLHFIEIQHFLSSEKSLHLNFITISALTIKDLKEVQDRGSDMRDEKQHKIIDWSSRILIRMNLKTNDPVFFFPPVVADFMSMADLAYWADRAVIGVDLTKSLIDNSRNFDQMTEIIYQQIVADYPNIVRYQFVGYSIGCLVGYDVLRKIQSKLGLDRVGKMILLDMTPYGAVTTLKTGQRMRQRNMLGWEAMKDGRAARIDSAFSDRRKFVEAMEKISGEKDGEKNFNMFFGSLNKLLGLDLDFDHLLKTDVLLFRAAITSTVSQLLSRVSADPQKGFDGLVTVEEINTNHFYIIRDSFIAILDAVNSYLPRYGDEVDKL